MDSIHVGTTLRSVRMPDGSLADFTYNLSGIPSTASDDYLDMALDTCDRLHRKMLERLGIQVRAAQRVSQPVTIAQPTIVNPAAFHHAPEPQAPEEPSPASPSQPLQEQAEAPQVQQTQVQTESQAQPEPPEIPADGEIETHRDVFGVSVEIPPVEWQQEPLTTTGGEGGGGQMLALNSGLSSVGFKYDLRHRASEAALVAFGEIHGYAVNDRIGSLYDLTKAEAHIILTLLDRATSEFGGKWERMMSAWRVTMDSLAGQSTIAPAEPAPEPSEVSPEMAPWQRTIEALEAKRAVEADYDPFDEANMAGIEVSRTDGDARTPEQKAEAFRATETPTVTPETDPDEPEEIQLSDDQRQALEAAITAIDRRKPCFIYITGQAGTGKSTVLRELRKARTVVVCAPTGIAALNVGGQTVHSMFRLKGEPLSRGNVRALRDDALEVIKRAKAVVLDEVSMNRADVLDAISWVLQKSLGNDLPFGGLPVIAFGDLMQLPPVAVGKERDILLARYRSLFWFDAKVFQSSEQPILDGEPVPTLTIETHSLNEIFRQRGDNTFIDALNAIRAGDPSGLFVVNSCAGKIPADEPTTLCLTNDKAGAINGARLGALPGEALTWHARFEGEFLKAQADDDEKLPAPKQLDLKVGAKVMFVKNGSGYVNGSIGTVVEFTKALCDDGTVIEAPVVRIGDEGSGHRIIATPVRWGKSTYAVDIETDEIISKEVGGFEQIPLKLAWAITVHKAQGQTLETAILEFERPCRTHGQAYVALSRVKSMAGLFLRRRLSPADLVVDPRVREFCGQSVAIPAPVLNLEAFA